MAAGGPARAAFDVGSVGNFTDVEIAGRDGRALNLQVALEAKIVVALDEELVVDRPVRLVAGGASFAQGFVFENERATLFAMTLRAGFVEARHGEAAGGLHDVVAVRVVTIHAVHLAFDDWMMLREAEFRMDVEMTLKTGGGIFAGIDDESSATAADADVFAGGPVAGFAAGDLSKFDVVLVEAAVGAGGEGARDVGMTIHAGGVADKMSAGNMRWHGHGPVEG